MAWGESLTPTQGGLIDTGAQLGSNIITAIMQTRENKKNREFNAEQAELAYQRQIALQDKQNAYNTPLAQMQRYKEAGLNPNIVAGQSNISAPAAAAPMAAGASGSVSPMALQTNFMAARQMEAQANLADAQANSLEELTPEQKKEIQSRYKLTDQEFNESLARVTQIQSNVKLLDAQRQFTTSQAAGQWIQNAFSAKTFDYNVDRIAAETQTSQTEASYAAAMAIQHVALLKAQTGQAISQAHLNYMNARVSYYQGRINRITGTKIGLLLGYELRQARLGADLTQAQLGQAQATESLLQFQDKNKIKDRIWNLADKVIGWACDLGKTYGIMLNSGGKE